MSHKYVLLKEVCEKASSNIAQKDLAECDGIYPIYGASGYIKSVDFFQQAKDYIAIVKDGAGIGRAMKLPAKSSVIGTMQYVLPKDNINISYLYYAICSMHLEKYFSGATIPHIYFRDYQNEQLPLPTLEEQAKIANVFGRIDYFIKKEKEQLINLDKLVKSRFIELFGDPVSNTKNIPVTEIAKKFFVTKLAGFEYTKYIKYQDSGDVIMVRGLNVKDKKLKLDDVYYIDSEVSDKLPRSQLKENDIVMTYVGVNIGDVALVDAKNKYHLAPNVAKISPYDINETNPVFFVYLLAFNKEHFAGNATNTAKQALNMEKIRKLQIILPKIELQNQFADFVAQVDKSKLAIQQSLDELETLKKSLMQQYFG